MTCIRPGEVFLAAVGGFLFDKKRLTTSFGYPPTPRAGRRWEGRVGPWAKGGCGNWGIGSDTGLHEQLDVRSDVRSDVTIIQYV